jgi:hypothetical protein
MSRAYTEDQLVEQGAIGSFAERGCINIQNLRCARDRLLPHLLSGQIELETEAA